LSALVVGDYAPMRQILRGILKEFGVGRVGEVNNGREAIEELQFAIPDVIFTDYMMEPINGLDLIETNRRG
jgi:CheY-like chemotaxis protein